MPIDIILAEDDPEELEAAQRLFRLVVAEASYDDVARSEELSRSLRELFGGELETLSAESIHRVVWQLLVAGALALRYAEKFTESAGEGARFDEAEARRRIQDALGIELPRLDDE